MRQVPHYLLIGNGRLSRHFQYYFSALKISFQIWHRKQTCNELSQALCHATHVLLLINDDAIEVFIQKYLSEYKGIRIHCSGSLVTALAYGAHPLMTFGKDLYELKRYQSVAFILDDDAPDFSILFPQLENYSSRINKKLKPKYHALCVLSGNFSCILWQKLFSTLESEFNLPAEIAKSYLSQQTENLLMNPNAALTGPLARRDYRVIEKNLAALKDDAFQAVYASFVECFAKLEEKKS